MSIQALSGIKVLDVGQHIAAPYCTKLFADFGTEVIKVEKPDGGDPARKSGPFPDYQPDEEKSGLFAYLNNNKLGITLNLKTDTGVKMFKDLVKKVDVLVENFDPHVMPDLRLAYDDLKSINPGLVMTSISNFGEKGPYRDYNATDIVLQALSGWVRTRGEPAREPISVAGGLGIVEYIGGTYAATGTMTALMHKIGTGAGQHVKVSLVEAAASMLSNPVAQNTFPRNPGWRKIRYVYTPGVEECKDGYIGINTLTGMQWKDLCAMMGMPDWAENPDYNTMVARFARRKEVRDRMHPWLMARTKEQILAEGIAWRVPVAMVNNTEELLNSPQYQARDYFVEVEHPVLGKVTQPGAPFKMTRTPWQIKRPAPKLGEHNIDVYGQLLGYKKSDLVRLRQGGVI
jgi:CoA:oxalate CoA-transferase